MREIVNGIFYVMRAGCPWRLLPSDLPPWGTIYRWFATFRDDGCFEKTNHALVMADRERSARGASPTGAIIDSQSVKRTEAGGPRGYDAGKKINGRKCHALVDTEPRRFLPLSKFSPIALAKFGHRQTQIAEWKGMANAEVTAGLRKCPSDGADDIPGRIAPHRLNRTQKA
jgi:transposase